MLADVWTARDSKGENGARTSSNNKTSAGLFPAGTGDCAAPKLLAAAAASGLAPLSMAEVWFGAPMVERVLTRRHRRCVEAARKEGQAVYAMTRVTPTRLEGRLYSCCKKCERILGWQLCSSP
mmetsp:Transcript_13877/g.24583  ORF Transcript_13877/g.24583 Transcript_13877/m.24583 type:complete len:123 (+) Transcript_13877:1053-1421(+)